MTLDKAIEYLDYILKQHPHIESADFGNAIKLGIEALKAVAKMRHYPFPDEILQLPGEDPE
jgi:hypothetical protein